MKTIMSMLTLLSVVFALSSTAHAIEKPAIDLLKGTLNGRAFYTLTIADLSALFGKPSHQFTESVPQLSFTTLIYQDLGFMAQVNNGTKKCRIIVPDISGKMIGSILTGPGMNPPKEQVKNLNIKKYTGVLSPPVDETWNFKRVMEQFKKNNPKANERQNEKQIGVEFKNYAVIFDFNTATELLEGILLLAPEPFPPRK